MSHSFTVKINSDLSSVLKKVENTVTSNGGIFHGSTSSGSFSGKTAIGIVKGEYRCTSSNEVEITITDKPFVVPYSTIESTIREYFS
jgi:effector-binding domain-containing protein